MNFILLTPEKYEQGKRNIAIATALQLQQLKPNAEHPVPDHHTTEYIVKYIYTFIDVHGSQFTGQIMNIWTEYQKRLEQYEAGCQSAQIVHNGIKAWAQKYRPDVNEEKILKRRFINRFLILCKLNCFYFDGSFDYQTRIEDASLDVLRHHFDYQYNSVINSKSDKVKEQAAEYLSKWRDEDEFENWLFDM
jgi:hypothetical protein